jgi:hypothetical protein
MNYFLRTASLLLLAACGVEQRRTEAPELPALAGYGKARPVDEARDPSLLAARDSILAIAGRRDSAALRQWLAPTIKFSFGDSRGGPDGLFAHWHKYESMERLWTVVTDVLTHGGKMQGPDSFIAPWTFLALPDSLDAFEYLVVRDSGVAVHTAPSAADSTIGTLSYDIVRRGAAGSDTAWRAVALPDGRTGFVETKSIRSPVEYRVGLRRFGARWMIDFFVAGD